MVKDFTCLGVQGGGMWKTQTVDGKDYAPYTENSLELVSRGYTNASDVNTCGGNLNCAKNYHCAFDRCKNRQNKVTMIRDPQK